MNCMAGVGGELRLYNGSDLDLSLVESVGPDVVSLVRSTEV